MTPTPEQQACIDAHQALMGTNDILLVGAYAGSGKTSTLELMSRAVEDSGYYLCFNKAIATASQARFPANVACKTAHSLAYGAMRYTYSKNRNRDKMVGNLYIRDTVQLLAIRDFPIMGATASLDKNTVAYAVNETVKRFRQSAEPDFINRHFPLIPKFETLPDENFRHLRTMVLSMAKVLWEKMVDPQDPTPLGHDGYVKAWQLTNPTINAGFIMVDEFQDTNPVLLDVLTQQDCPIIGVGDRHQQIYEWRGAVNAMELLAERAKHTLYLTKSFRFGKAVADFASDVLATIGETNRIEGNERIESKLTREAQKVVLCRTNGQILNALIAEAESKDKRSISVVGGVDDLVRIIDGVEALQASRSSSYPLFIGFKNWPEFLAYTEKSSDPDAEKIVKMVDNYGTQELKAVLARVTPSESSAQLLLSTAHKSKGREWEGVELADDFRPQPEVDKATGALNWNGPETRLFYVAATRAINSLNVPQWARDTYGVKPEAKEAA